MIQPPGRSPVGLHLEYIVRIPEHELRLRASEVEIGSTTWEELRRETTGFGGMRGFG